MSHSSLDSQIQDLHNRSRRLFVASVYLFRAALLVAVVGVGVGVWIIGSRGNDGDITPAVAIVGIAAVMGFSHLGLGNAAGRLEAQRNALIEKSRTQPPS